MAKIVYEFPSDGPQNFHSAEGYIEIQVIDGKLELDDEPVEALLNLIKKFEGKRVKEVVAKATKKSTTEKKDGDD